MARLIQLTRVDPDTGECVPTYVNPDHISMIRPSSDGGSYVTLLSGVGVYPDQSPQQILDLLADHRRAVRAEERDGIEVYP
jgi:hypothetical protein